MIRLIAVLLGLALGAAGPAGACPKPSDELLFHSCWGDASARIALLPEDAPVPERDEGMLLAVTGAYTGRETRGEDLPNPVGFFMRDGLLVNRNMSRMDGLLVVDPKTGAVALHDRAAVAMGDRVYNLRQVAPRRTFTAEAAERGLSVLQSHLLIIDGEIDVADQDDAPLFRRRVLFTDEEGYGVFQSDGAVTLYAAAARLDELYAPRMALNLDMGSYDYCLRAEAGEERLCGLLDRGQTEKLSNLIILTLE